MRHTVPSGPCPVKQVSHASHSADTEPTMRACPRRASWEQAVDPHVVEPRGEATAAHRHQPDPCVGPDGVVRPHPAPHPVPPDRGRRVGSAQLSTVPALVTPAGTTGASGLR